MKNLSIKCIGGIAAAMVLACCATPAANASSHREAPLISIDPSVDNTDLYAFIHPSAPDKVNLVACFIPFEDPAGGPNFYRFDESAVYDINVDNVGDAKPHITFEFTFHNEISNPDTFLYNTGPILSLNDPNYNVRQYYDLAVIHNDLPSRPDRRMGRGSRVREVIASHVLEPPCNVGDKSTPNYEALAMSSIANAGHGIRVFVGQRDDPFFVDVGSIFDLLTLRPFPAPVGTSSPGKDSPTSGMNVHALCLEVPIAYLTKDGQVPAGPTASDAVIGVWSTASRPRVTIRNTPGGEAVSSGDLRQVSRLDIPLVNEVLIPVGKKDRWNASEPKDDGQFLEYVTEPEVPLLLKALYNIDTPPTPRNDLVTIALTGISGLNQPPNVVPSSELRLNLGIPPVANPNRMGILGGDTAGFPNGRRLTDDVVDILLQVLAGATPFTPTFNVSPNNLLGDGVDANDIPFKNTFPYLATPHQGLNHVHSH